MIDCLYLDMKYSLRARLTLCNWVFLYVRRIRIILCRTDFRMFFSQIELRFFFVVLLASHNPKTTIKKMSVCMSVRPICSLCRFWSISSCSIAFYFHMWLIWTIPQGCFSSDFSFDPPLFHPPQKWQFLKKVCAGFEVFLVVLLPSTSICDLFERFPMGVFHPISVLTHLSSTLPPQKMTVKKKRSVQVLKYF